jgi:hypothetical protein
MSRPERREAVVSEPATMKRAELRMISSCETPPFSFWRRM